MQAIATNSVNTSLSRHPELPLSVILAAHESLRFEAYSRDGRSWVVQVKGADFKDSPDSAVIGSMCGSGRSTDLALSDICTKLGGKVMVVYDKEGARSGSRQMFQLPQK